MRTPFVIADLDQHNAGVYYEAGLKSAFDFPEMRVIHCIPESQKDDTHFDVKQINSIIYTDDVDLCKKLKALIEGQFGDGPFLGSLADKG